MTDGDKRRLRVQREHLMRLLYLRDFHEADEIGEQNQLYFDVILPNESKAADQGSGTDKDGSPKDIFEDQDLTDQEDIKDKVLEKYNRILEKLPEIDQVLVARMSNWNISRVGLVEKAILRISVYEILYEELPKPISVNEAVILAKEYGGTQSSGFVNGVLSKLKNNDQE